MISSSTSRTVFYTNTFAPFRNPVIGLGVKQPITEKKTLNVSLLYSHTTMGYYYIAPTDSVVSITTPYGKGSEGVIKMNGLLLNTALQYNIFKWLDVKVGLNHYFNFSNHFDTTETARYIGWQNDNGRSNIRQYNLAFNYGLAMRLSKRWVVEINAMRGINNFIVLKEKPYQDEQYPMKLHYGSLTIGYKIW
ncbi:MAG: hypothetical protein V4613_10825 [Bacteroidota bacterium]